MNAESLQMKIENYLKKQKELNEFEKIENQLRNK